MRIRASGGYVGQTTAVAGGIITMIEAQISKSVPVTFGSSVVPAGASSTVIQSFISSGSWTAPTGVTSIEMLMIAGGGGGGNTMGGGGGAGGLFYNATQAVNARN